MTKPKPQSRKAKGRRKPPVPGIKSTPRNSYTSPEVIKRQAQIKRALEFRLEAKSYPEIGRLMSIGTSTAYDMVIAGLKQMIREPSEQLRELELERTDKLMGAHFKAAIAGNIERTNVVLKISERRSKLLGLDKPQELELSGEIGVRKLDLTDKDRARAMAAFIAKVKAKGSEA